jgi:hypothetical protein
MLLITLKMKFQICFRIIIDLFQIARRPGRASPAGARSKRTVTSGHNRQVWQHE